MNKGVKGIHFTVLPENCAILLFSPCERSEYLYRKLVVPEKACIMGQTVMEGGCPSMHFSGQLVLRPSHKVQPAAKVVRPEFARPRSP